MIAFIFVVIIIIIIIIIINNNNINNNTMCLCASMCACKQQGAHASILSFFAGQKSDSGTFLRAETFFPCRCRIAVCLHGQSTAYWISQWTKTWLISFGIKILTQSLWYLELEFHSNGTPTGQIGRPLLIIHFKVHFFHILNTSVKWMPSFEEILINTAQFC